MWQKIKDNLLIICLAAGVILLLIMLLRTCNNKPLATTINTDSLISRTHYLADENNRLIAENDVQKVAIGKQLKAYTDTIFNLKKQNEKRVAEVQQYTKVIEDLKAKGIVAHYVHDTTKIIDTVMAQDTRDLIEVPIAFEYKDSTLFFLHGKVTLDGVQIDTIGATNDINLRTVEKHEGFLGLKHSTVVQAVNSNPYFSLKGVASVTVPYRANWWQRWGKPTLTALVTGYLVYKLK